VFKTFREAFSPSFILSKTSAQIKAWRETPLDSQITYTGKLAS